MTQSQTPTPNPIDLHVGARVRSRRKFLGVSQERLANALGLTFQQVQKYERGTNRISASKLFEISRALGTPVAHFFQGLNAEADEPAVGEEAGSVHTFLMTPEGVELAQIFPSIQPRLRRRILELARTLSDPDELDVPGRVPTSLDGVAERLPS